jgi:hypothetical protein
LATNILPKMSRVWRNELKQRNPRLATYITRTSQSHEKHARCVVNWGFVVFTLSQKSSSGVSSTLRHLSRSSPSVSLMNSLMWNRIPSAGHSSGPNRVVSSSHFTREIAI